MAQGAIAALSVPFSIGAHSVSLTPYMGAVLAPRDGGTPVELLRKVDLATCAAREQGANGLAFFDQRLEGDAQRRVRMFSQLRLDAERNAFSFVAQPKVDGSARAVGAELLMRWPTAAFGMVSPVEFIPLAEKLGLIGLMGRHALHAAARLAARCRAAGQVLPVAVNLSPRQVLQAGLDRQLLLACERVGIGPELLEVELTESALLAGLDVVKPVLQRLRRHGFALALDDFGTGYSSLSYLRHLPFSKVKIDRSFVLDIEHDDRALRMLDPMVRLCEVLGMSTVAEGVETAAQFEALRGLGIQEFQGYHFARPMPLDDWACAVEAAAGKPVRLPA
jgi:EAL domain-containing protein (putative c-di-GMP-specific phosphodiesterase class I)